MIKVKQLIMKGFVRLVRQNLKDVKINLSKCTMQSWLEEQRHRRASWV